MLYKNMYYTKEGDGNVVLFLHGWGATGDIWKNQQKALAKRFCVVCVDFFGFGQSPPPNMTVGVAFYAQKTAELLDHLNVEKVSVVAHSFGGRVAILLANLIPEKVTKLVLVDSAGLRRFSLKKCLLISLYKTVKRLVKIGLFSAEILKRFGSCDYKALTSEMRGTFRAVTQQDLSFFLPLIACPTLLIWGRNDKETPLWIARKMNRKIRGSALVFIGFGHFGAYENPLHFNACLASFLG